MIDPTQILQTINSPDTFYIQIRLHMGKMIELHPGIEDQNIT